MIVGFTGTRTGLTALQSQALLRGMDAVAASESRHGCCVGADAAFHALALAAWPGRRRIGHPANIPSLRAPCPGLDEVMPEKPPLERNRDIVAASGILLACPGGMEEEWRSGTWATIRAARKKGVPVVLFFPDGSVRREP